MYNWRKMTEAQRIEVAQLRKQALHPWHSPSHVDSERTARYHLTAACYEHKPVIGESPQRMSSFSFQLFDLLKSNSEIVHAWAVLPNHYHALVTTTALKRLLAILGKFHGRLSFEWNGEESLRGRQVWCKAAETAMKSEGHFWATMNYIHHNPVHHRYAERWQDWPFSSAASYLEQVGTEQAKYTWNEYPIKDYGKGWDPEDF